MTVHAHEVSVVAGGKRLPGWKNYSISVDMLQPADAFSVEVQFTPEAWRSVPPDQPIDVYVDSTRIMSGFVDSRTKSSDPDSGTVITLEGRDKVGRLVDESSMLFRYGGLTLVALAEKIAGVNEEDPLFQNVILSNAKNRSLLRSVHARKARVVREPVIENLVGTFRPFVDRFGVKIPDLTRATSKIGYDHIVKRPPLIDPGIFQGRSAPKKVPPGTTGWAVLEGFLKEARLLAWSSADGVSLIIGLPNYDQESQWYFHEPWDTTPDGDPCRITVMDSVAEVYSKIVALGAARGTGSDYGKGTHQWAHVFDNPENEHDGTGLRFQRRKLLIISDDSIRSPRDAVERAEREQLEREISSSEVTVDVAGHSQSRDGGTPALYAVDTMARVKDDATGTDGDYLVTAVELTLSPDAGERTTLKLVPHGTLLQL